MEIDLTRVNAESLSFNARHPLAEALSKQILDMCVGERDKRAWPQLMVARYVAGQRLHHCVAQILQVESEFRVFFTYLLDARAGVRPTRTNRPRQLLECLSQISDSIQFDCFALFEYPEGKGQSLLSLPLKLFTYSSLPFDEIRGLRLVKVKTNGDGRLDYSVIVDRPSNREVHHSITFPFESHYLQQLPAVILQRAEEISLAFYRREQNGS